MFDEQLGKISPTPPRSASSLPGLKIRSAFLSGTLTTPIVVFSLLAVLTIPLELSQRNRKFSPGDFKTTNGTVIEVTDYRRFDQTKIVYTFRTDAGEEYRQVQNIWDGSAYAGVKNGESVPVEFLISDPTVSRISERERPDAPNFFFLIPLIFLVIFSGPVVFSRLIRIVRDRRLFRRGCLASGAVVFVKTSAVFMWWGWSGASTAQVYVSYQGSDGTPLEARTLCQNDWLVEHLAPGTLVHIAYLPHRPQRAVLLEAYVR